MSRSTLVKYKGKIISDLGRTINQNFFPPRGRNLDYDNFADLIRDKEEDTKKFITKTIVALAAHHPTKDELDEIVMDLDSFIDDVAETLKEIGMSRLLLELSDADDVEIEFL